jgi:alpha-beta hydrolase superfamily lysophospholipase
MAAEIRHYTAGDGAGLAYRLWGAGGADALVYLHGIESHAEWFAGCAGEIAKAGVAVYGLDRRGSGLNAEGRGHCLDFRRLVDDVVEFAGGVREAHRKLHLAALSWGGKPAVVIDMLHPGTFSTITLLVPGLFPRVMPGIGERVAIAFDAIFRPATPHPIPIEDEMFTSLPEYLAYIANDPLRLRRVTARFYLETVKLDRLLKSRGYQWTAPTQILLAEHDAIVDNDRIEEMFASLEMKRKKLHVFPGSNHSIQFERIGDVADHVVRWIRESDEGVSAPGGKANV